MADVTRRMVRVCLLFEQHSSTRFVYSGLGLDSTTVWNLTLNAKEKNKAFVQLLYSFLTSKV
jgi:hypothetical protein